MFTFTLVNDSVFGLIRNLLLLNFVIYKNRCQLEGMWTKGEFLKLIFVSSLMSSMLSFSYSLSIYAASGNSEWYAS